MCFFAKLFGDDENSEPHPISYKGFDTFLI